MVVVNGDADGGCDGSLQKVVASSPVGAGIEYLDAG
jgi:hypothetical protein